MTNPTPPLDDLDATIRRVDPDRWLSTRFIADETARAAVIALYAYNYELARVAGGVRDALMGEIRLTWWREAMEELLAGKTPRRHPVVEAIAKARIPYGPLVDMAEARLADLDPPPENRDQGLAYIDATAGAVMMLAAIRLDPGADPHAVKGAARAFGISGLHRLGRLWPEADAKTEVAAALKDTRRQLKDLPVGAFPAAAYAALATGYVKARAPTDFEKRARLTLAVMTGRI
jgi:15-cis-phytoene synthase